MSYDFSILLLSLELSNMLIGTSSLHVVPQMTFRHTRVLKNLPRYYTMQPPLLQYFSSPIHLKVPHNVSDTKNWTDNILYIWSFKKSIIYGNIQKVFPCWLMWWERIPSMDPPTPCLWFWRISITLCQLPHWPHTSGDQRGMTGKSTPLFSVAWRIRRL